MGGLEHIPSRRLVDFMLRQIRLTEQEDDHLAKCALCQKEMSEATIDEMQTPPPAEEENVHVLSSRLVSHMRRQSPLTERESDHLARCQTCQQEMVEAAKRIENWPSSEGDV
jgi:hypothetical protein